MGVPPRFAWTKASTTGTRGGMNSPGYPRFGDLRRVIWARSDDVSAANPPLHESAGHTAWISNMT